MARASQMVCPKLSRLCFYQGVQGWSHYKLDVDGGSQFMWGCDIISRSDESIIISRSNDIISRGK